MKHLPIFLLSLIMLCTLGYGNGKSDNYPMYLTKDSLPAGIFYNDMQDLDSIKKSIFINDTLNELDSTYYIEYTSKINDYAVRGYIKSICECADGYIGLAVLFFTKDSTTRNISHLSFYMPDSVFKEMRTRQINYIEYPIRTSDDFGKNQLGQFKDVPFAFFDIDFDGEKELILRHPFIGQRLHSSYSPFKESITDINSFEEDYIYNPIDSFIMKSDEYAYFPILDDMTEFDYKNNELIVYMSAGWAGSEKLYYKINNRKPILNRKEVYYCGFDTLAKRITYISNDTIIQYFNNAKRHGIY